MYVPRPSVVLQQLLHRLAPPHSRASRREEEDAPGEDEEGGGYGLGTHVAAGADG